MRLGPSTALLVLAAALVVGCGSSSNSATPTPRATPTATARTGGPTATTAPTETPEDTSGPSGPSGGSAVDTSLPSIVDGAWNKGTGHVEITGDWTASFDGAAGGYGTGGFAIVTIGDQTKGYGAQFSISNTESSGLSISGPGFISGGTWGAGCTLTITHNEVANLAGEFSCPNAEGADLTKNLPLKVNIKGSFSLTP